MLEGTAIDVNGGGYDTGYGYGRVNALAAVNLAINYTPPVDNTIPSVAMTSPGNGATVSGTAVVDVVADDNVGVVKVDLYVDDVFFASDTASPYSFAWDTTALTNGAYTLRAVAADAAGNTASTLPVTLTVANTPPDNTPPSVSINAPAAGATVSGTTTVTATATDKVGVVSTALYVDGVLSTTDATAPYAYTWNTTQVADGSHTLDVLASDAAGNSAHAVITVIVSNKVKHAPVAVDDAYTTTYPARSTYVTRVYAVLANDRDADGDLNAASVRITSSPNKGGSVRANTDGTVSYTPKQGYRGVEVFRYTVKDKLGATSNTATVRVTVQTSRSDVRRNKFLEGARIGREMNSRF